MPKTLFGWCHRLSSRTFRGLWACCHYEVSETFRMGGPEASCRVGGGICQEVSVGDWEHSGERLE